MKAAVYYETGAPEVFRYETVPDPAVTAHRSQFRSLREFTVSLFRRHV